MQALMMIQAFLTRFAELHPDLVDGEIGEEYIFIDGVDGGGIILIVRLCNEGYEYSTLDTVYWYPLQSVSQLKELLNNS